MAVINFTKDFYKSNMPLYHEKSDRIYAIPQEVYRSLCEKHGGVLHSNAPDLVLDCYSIKATGDGIIEQSKIELPLKDIKGIWEVERAGTITFIYEKI